MKKFLLRALAVATLTGCLSTGESETDSLLVSTAKQVGSVYVTTAKNSVSSACMAKYNNSLVCECVTSSVVDSLSTSDLKNLYNKVRGKTTTNAGAVVSGDATLRQKITSAQINCMVSKLYQ